METPQRGEGRRESPSVLLCVLSGRNKSVGEKGSDDQDPWSPGSSVYSVSSVVVDSGFQARHMLDRRRARQSTAVSVMMTFTTVERVFQLVPPETDWKVRSTSCSAHAGHSAMSASSRSTQPREASPPTEIDSTQCWAKPDRACGRRSQRLNQVFVPLLYHAVPSPTGRRMGGRRMKALGFCYLCPFASHSAWIRVRTTSPPSPKA